MIKSLRQARITDGLPRVVAGQDWVIALSEALGLAMEQTLAFTDVSQIYTRLDSVPEKVLDVLAVNWKIDWYDTEFTVEQKRRIVQSALAVRRMMGTAAAVKMQTDSIYPGASVEEWFQYDGKAGYFRIALDVPEQGFSKKDFVKLRNGVMVTKNVRSHLEEIKLRYETKAAVKYGICSEMAGRIDIWPRRVTEIRTTGKVAVAGALLCQGVVEIFPEGGVTNV